MTYISLRNNLIDSHNAGNSWRKISDSYPGVSAGTLCRIALDQNYLPRNKDIRRALGLYQPRRKYDRTTKEMRAIGMSLLAKLMTR